VNILCAVDGDVFRMIGKHLYTTPTEAAVSVQRTSVKKVRWSDTVSNEAAVTEHVHTLGGCVPMEMHAERVFDEAKQAAGGVAFNEDSPRDIAHVLYDVLQLPTSPKRAADTVAAV
jgi:hypothetical protein